MILPVGNAKLFVDQIFRIFDKDGNGTIDFKEFMMATDMTASGSPEEKLRQDQCDHIRPSFTTLANILKIFGKHFKNLWQNFATLANYLKIFGKELRSYLVFCKILNLLCQKNISGQIFQVVGQRVYIQCRVTI